jgi:hypothetical protein
MARMLHTYQCRNCKTVATSPVFHDYFNRPLCCNLCRSYMKFMWSEPITTKEQEALADRGPVWNPGTESQCLPEDGQGRR